MLLELGWGSEPTKHHGPRDRLDALGADVDIASGRLWLTKAKGERYAVHAESVASVQQCDHTPASFGCWAG